ncbi:Protein-glutamate methylesterase/protein-glutamine glutaminase [Neobacillus rhizosphaerae]|uniref:Protein-glutamate methylesterase/protein-glutamine glutaminase n=1 Tax=Neobacillus rhizosphaerae TaxID=2880965 RepID=A0ABN8KTP4_9BACI|nr:Protein-glutamate methylesterase/protein-glutamine glutaminase [Neobacillus rhizosphaerae]
MIALKFFIVDDSTTIRAMLSNIIEEEDLGTVAGEAEDGSEIYADILAEQEIDILMIDLLMPNRDGIETIREIAPFFHGKIIMISQVETKDMIGEAYSLGVDHYITKPINRLEVVNILKKVSHQLQLEKSLIDIQKSLSHLTNHTQKRNPEIHFQSTQNPIIQSGKNILCELGIIGESGIKDLLDILAIFSQLEKDGVRETPSLKDLYEKIIKKRFGPSISPQEVRKEMKAGEQRIRRTIHQALEHIASLGLTDYTNPKFENYSSSFFDYTQVRMKMLELEGKAQDENSHSRINIKKFIQALYWEAKG